VVDGQSLTFEVFGLLRDVLTMVDRQTETVWTHLDGKAIQGALEGQRMTMVPIPLMTWGEWKSTHTDTMVLSPNTPFQDRYTPMRIGVPNQGEARFGDDRLDANALVVGVEVAGEFKGYPLHDLGEVGGVVNDTLGTHPIIVIYDKDIQTGVAFSRLVAKQALDFYNTAAKGFELRDKQTNSAWGHNGKAVSGPLAGESLDFIPSFIYEWYG
jgi:hypothetical protein